MTTLIRMVDQTRNWLLVVAIVLLIFVSSANGTYAQCMMSLVNTVVYDGTLNTVFDCTTGPNGTSWSVLPTSNWTKTYAITNFNGTVSPAFSGFYAFNEPGLIVIKATTYGYGKENATAGIYIVSFDPKNPNNKTAIKLVVIHSGPTCCCNQLTSGSVNISCTIVYADHPVAPMTPVMSCTANGHMYNGTTPNRGTIPIPLNPPEYVWSSTPYAIVNNTDPTTYDCLMTFVAPVGGPAYVSRTVPEFSATRQVVCGQTTCASPTTSVQPTASRKSLITTTKPLSTTTKPTTTTTQAQKTTQIPRTTAGVQDIQSDHGQCTTPPINQVVYEGATNTIMTCNSNPNTVSWTVTPTNNEQFPSQITNYNDTVTPSLVPFFDAIQTNLIIKMATNPVGTGTSPMATSGVYIAQYSTLYNARIGAKLIVVRGGPTCNCTAINSSSNNLTCSLTYADAITNPIYAKVTWTANGNLYSTTTLSSRTKVNNVFTSTSTITVNVSDSRAFKCSLIFTQPMIVTVPYIANNAPAFYATCSPRCG